MTDEQNELAAPGGDPQLHEVAEKVRDLAKADPSRVVQRVVERMEAEGRTVAPEDLDALHALASDWELNERGQLVGDVVIPPADGSKGRRFKYVNDDGERVHPPNPKRLTPQKVQDYGVIADGCLTRALSERYVGGVALDAVALEPRAVVDEAAPRGPVEALVLRSMSLAASQQRHLLDLSTRVSDIGKRQRYAELALRASREVMRAASVWRELRKPPSVSLGPGSQANVVGGDQVLNASNE